MLDDDLPVVYAPAQRYYAVSNPHKTGPGGSGD